MLDLALEEQEISISQMGDNRDEWVIVSSDKVWQARLKKMGFEPEREQGPTRWYRVPATCIIVRKPPNIKPKSEEQLERSRMAMRAMQAKLKAQKEANAE